MPSNHCLILKLMEKCVFVCVASRVWETSWPSATHTVTSPFELWKNILSTLFRLFLQFFILSLSMIHPPPPPPSSSFPLLYNVPCVLCLCASVYTQLCALIVGVTHFRSVFESASPPTVCLCWDSGCPLIFKHPLIQIQKLMFPPLRAGSHWDRIGMAHYANEASFMDAANDGSLQKSVQISVDARKCSTFSPFQIYLHRRIAVHAASTWKKNMTHTSEKQLIWGVYIWGAPLI